MKKLLFLLLTISAILILPGCKKILDGIVPAIPDEPTITAVGTPVGNVVTKLIGKSGGSIASADGNAELIFPAGALNDNTTITVQAITNNAPNGVANAYRFLPQGIKFLKPVTLKFHYTAKNLAATLGDLMGIAFQQSSGIWYRVNNFTNDTVSKIISAPIKHFTDYTHFDMLIINPIFGDLKVNKTLDLKLDMVGTDDDLLAQLGPNNDEELAPLIKLRNKKIIWSANGVENGNSKYGTITSTFLNATFKAPAKVPSQNPVAVSALVDVKFKYHGKTFDRTSLVSNITIIDGQKYLLELRQTETAAPFVYKDTASLTVLISADGKVTVADILNFAPVMNPGTATLGDCTSTWIPEGIGEINITTVTGTISGSSGDSKRDLILQFGHSGTVIPKFRRVCNGGTEEILGGNAIPGFPPFVFFTLTPDAGIYFTDDGQEYARLTLLE